MLAIQVIINGLTAGTTLALVAIGLTLIFGILGVVNFVHGIIFMLGAYITIFFTTTFGVNYFLSLGFAMLATGLFGVLLEIMFFQRFRGRALEGAVFAVAIALFFEAAAFELFGGTPRGVITPIPGVFNWNGLILNKHRIFVVVCSLFVMGLLYYFVRYTRWGMAMRAVQQDSYAARLQGIDDKKIAILAFGLGAALAGIAGGLVVPLQLALPNMGTFPLLMAFVAIIVGGMGSVVGAFFAALAIGMIQSVVTTFISSQAVIGITFLIAIIVLIVRPTGLAGNR